MLVVGENTYITVEEADTWVNEYLTSNDEQRIKWESLTEADKEVYLRKSATSLNAVKWIGKTVADYQLMAWPRLIHCVKTEQVPQDIKNAQAAETVEMCSPLKPSQDSNIKSYSIGSLSETFKTTTSDSFEQIIKSDVARMYCGKYVGGSYEIR